VLSARGRVLAAFPRSLPSLTRRLTIAGERKDEYRGEEGGVSRSECSYGRFERSIALPEGLDPNAIDAKFENGVLELSAPLPKKESRSRRIEVKGGGARAIGGGSTPSH